MNTKSWNHVHTKIRLKLTYPKLPTITRIKIYNYIKTHDILLGAINITRNIKKLTMYVMPWLNTLKLLEWTKLYKFVQTMFQTIK